MTRIRPGEPGHGGRTACLRLRPVRIVNGIPQGGWTDQWELICPACGDDVNLDFVTISPFLQRLRGPYASEAEGMVALRRHRGRPELSPAAAPSPSSPAPPPSSAPLHREAAVPTVPTGTAASTRLASRPQASGASERL